MPRTETDRREAAQSALELIHEMEQEGSDMTHHRANADAMLAVAEAEAQVREAVTVARAEGKLPWSVIAAVLGVSRQAARQQFDAGQSGTTSPESVLR